VWGCGKRVGGENIIADVLCLIASDCKVVPVSVSTSRSVWPLAEIVSFTPVRMVLSSVNRKRLLWRLLSLRL